MNASVLKGLLALAGASVFLAVSTALFVTRRDLSGTLLATGIGWFGVMASTHVFEAFSILPAFGWGQPHSIGYFIDLAAALLGITFVTLGFVVHPAGVVARPLSFTVRRRVLDLVRPRAGYA